MPTCTGSKSFKYAIATSILKACANCPARGLQLEWLALQDAHYHDTFLHFTHLLHKKLILVSKKKKKTCLTLAKRHKGDCALELRNAVFAFPYKVHLVGRFVFQAIQHKDLRYWAWYYSGLSKSKGCDEGMMRVGCDVGVMWV